MLDMLNKEKEDLIILKSIKDSYDDPEAHTKKYLKHSKITMGIVFISAFVMGFVNKGYSLNPFLILAIGGVTGFLIGLSIHYRLACKNIEIINKYNVFNKDIIEKHINDKET